MFLIKIFHFLKGYVILSLSGDNKDAFLNSIVKKGIVPYKLEYRDDRILAEVSVTDFFKIKNAGVKAKIHIEKRCGLVFFLKKLKMRKAFIIGMILFLLMFGIGSQFVWSISYEGVENCDMAQLENAVRRSGISVGKLKMKLRPPLEMKNIILNNTDDICWAWVYVNGTKVIVRVREEILPPEVYSPDIPCDIIAMRNGIIKNVITRHGKCLVGENQAVVAGDTIISGTYEFEGKPGYQVHSSGDVFAYTVHERTGTYKQNYCYKKYTGRKRNVLVFRLFGTEIPLSFGDIKFDDYDLTKREYDWKIGENFYTGIGMTKTSYAEYETVSEPVSYDAAVMFAQQELEKNISRELLPGAELVDKKTSVQKIDEETISVTVTMNFIEKIGTEKLIEEVTFVEPKTDNFAAGG